MSGTVSIAAASVNNNIVAGRELEFIPVLSQLQFGFYTGGHADIVTGDVTIDVICGGETLTLQDIVSSSAAANPRMPVFPDDFHLTSLAAAGDRLVIRARNADPAQAATLNWVMILTAL